MDHKFTKVIRKILQDNFGDISDEIYSKSDILKYLNIKTKSAHRGSKYRGSFANIYAVYVLVEDYLRNNFHIKKGYEEYEGAKFSILLKRQRRLPFGAKLQNHALNHRMNQEFHQHFPTCDFVPIIRDVDSNRYWFNENLLKIKIKDTIYNISHSIIQIIDSYVEVKKGAFKQFIDTIENLKKITDQDSE